MVCLGCLVLCSEAGQAVDAAAAESVAGAFEGEDVGVVDDAVDHGSGEGPGRRTRRPSRFATIHNRDAVSSW